MQATETLNLAKCWIYNELADIPEEFIVVEMSELQELDQAIEKVKSIQDLTVRDRILKELENKKYILEHSKQVN